MLTLLWVCCSVYRSVYCSAVLRSAWINACILEYSHTVSFLLLSGSFHGLDIEMTTGHNSFTTMGMSGSDTKGGQDAPADWPFIKVRVSIFLRSLP